MSEIDTKLDKILGMLALVIDNQLETIEKINKISDRVYDLEVSILGMNLPEDNPIKIRLANRG